MTWWTGIHKAGFSLLELVITVAILAIGVVPIISTMSQAMVADWGMERRTIAIFLARGKMEELKGTAWASVASSGPTSFASPFDMYQNQVVVTTDGTMPGLKNVQVTVSWTEQGTTLDNSLYTFMARLTP